MFSSNTETRISATYEDGDGTIDLVVDDMTANTNYYLTGLALSSGTLTATVSGASNPTVDLSGLYTACCSYYSIIRTIRHENRY